MSSTPELRLSVAASLLGPAEAALRQAGAAEGVRLVGDQPGWPGWEARQKGDYRRLWLELRSARGAGAGEADQALEDGSVRAALRLLRREADAALIEPGADGARELLDAGCDATADVYFSSEKQPQELAWLSWPDGDWNANIARTVAAAEWLSRRGGGAAYPLLVSFAGGRDPAAAATTRWFETLRARIDCLRLELYSPLFYREGRLQAGALAAAVAQGWRHSRLAQARAVVCIPQLKATEFGARWQAEGGARDWSGPFRAGAAVLWARLGAGEATGRWAATLRDLGRLRLR